MSKIEWTDKTWNPVTGCNKVSKGCKNCYAEVMHRRQMFMNPHKYTKPFLSGVELHPEELNKPLHWKKPCRIFVNSMSDLFHDDVPELFIRDVLKVAELCPQHTFQILTKRPKRMLEIVSRLVEKVLDGVPLPNVWLGVSCEDQAAADERIPLLLQVPATVRFLSCEPLLGSISILQSVRIQLSGDPALMVKAIAGNLSVLKGNDREYLGVDWIITGGESGRGARPTHPEWVRSIRDYCQKVGIPFFFKQWGEYYPVDSETILTNEMLTQLPSRFFSSPLETVELIKLGKRNAGNILDGRQHLEFPTI